MSVGRSCVHRSPLTFVLVCAAALAWVLAAAPEADPHRTPPYCGTAVHPQSKAHPGSATRVYIAPHGCVRLDRFDPRKTRRGPYRINLRVHSILRTLTPPLPRAVVHPEFTGFCAPDTFIVQWPFVIHSAPQRLPARSGRHVCSRPIMWIAQIDQFATRATWRVFTR